MTPDQVAQERALAQQMEATGMNFSPVQSWSQGLARVAQGLVGGIEAKRAREAADANTAESSSVAQALMSAGAGGPDKASVAAALVNPYLDDTTRQLAVKEYERLNPKPAEPHFFEANNGDQGAIDPVTGQVKIVYHDPTPKVNWMTVDNGDGTKSLIPVVNGQVMQGGGGPASGAGAGSPPATLPPDFDFGGPTPRASGTFP